MVYRRNEVGHIRSENVEFISVTAFRDIASSEQTYSAVFQTLDRTNAHQFIEGCPHRHITAKPLYQFAVGSEAGFPWVSRKSDSRRQAAITRAARLYFSALT